MLQLRIFLIIPFIYFLTNSLANKPYTNKNDLDLIVKNHYQNNLLGYGGSKALFYVGSGLGSSQIHTICFGDSVFLEGDYQTANGIYSDTLMASNGQDSIVLTKLIVLAVIPPTYQSLAICEEDSAFLGGEWRDTYGVYYDTLKTLYGCDSVLVSSLYVLPTTVQSNVINVCHGDSCFAGGAWQKTSGIYYDTFPNINGCNSIMITNLAIMDTPSSITYHSGCDSIYYNSSWYKASTTIQNTYSSSDGCDSLVYVVIDVSHKQEINRIQTICDGDSMFVGGAWQKTAGSYIDHLVSSNGVCDSIVTTELYISPLPNPGNGIDSTVCSNIGGIDLSSLLNGTPNLGGLWIDLDRTGMLNGNVFSVPTGQGQYSFSYEVEDVNCSNSSIVTLSVEDCLGIVNQKGSHFTLSPNPAQEHIYIDTKGEYIVHIVNAIGKTVQSTKIYNKTILDISDLPNGVYFIQLNNDLFGSTVQQLVVE